MKVSKQIKRVAIFAGVCFAGLFVSMAGGIEWGSFDAGGMAAGTMIAGVMMATFPLK